MLPANPASNRKHTILAGIEVGVLGGLLMLGWLALVSLLYGRTIWHPSNLLATTFYGGTALRRGFRWATLSGMALHLVVCAALAVAFGFAIQRVRRRGRIFLLGLAAGLAWYLFGFHFFWQQVNPLVLRYQPAPAMLFAHLLFGVFLGTLPAYRGAVERAELRPPAAPEPPRMIPAEASPEAVCEPSPFDEKLSSGETARSVE